MAFVITRDFFAESDPTGQTKSSAGVVGPNGTVMSKDAIKAVGIRFRMYDDDKQLCYEGKHVGSDQFEPLDCFGAPNLGCTEIRYLEKGVWKPL